MLLLAVLVPLLCATHCAAGAARKGGGAASRFNQANRNAGPDAAPPAPFAAGSLESVMDLLKGYESDVENERSIEAQEEHARELACNRSMERLREDIAKVVRERGDLVSTSMYESIGVALDGAVSNARSHFLNASSWSERAADAYLSTGKELEAANTALQDMEETHDAVVGTLKALSKVVKEHKNERLDHRVHTKQRGPVVTGQAAHAATALLEAASGHASAAAVTTAKNLRKLLDSVSASPGFHEQGWHDRVISMAASVAESVLSSKFARAQSLRAKVDNLAAMYARQGREMKAALRAKAVSKDALLEAKRSKGIIEKHEEETAQKRIQLHNATAAARKELEQVSASCEHAHQDWVIMDTSSSESLGTLHDFVEDLSSRKKVQDVKLKRAVAMLNAGR